MLRTTMQPHAVSASQADNRWALRRLDLGFAVLAAVALLLGWLQSDHVTSFDVMDSVLYRTIADEPLGLGTLFMNKRPFLYPLLIRLCGNHAQAVVAVQFVIYAIAWGFLAWRLYAPLRDAGRPLHGFALAALTLWVGLFPEFSGWNHRVLTESLSISGTVAAAAFLLDAVRLKRDRYTCAAIGCAVAVAVIRDASAYASLCEIPIVAALALTRCVRWPAALGCIAALVASYVFMTWSSDHVLHDPMMGRWTFPILNDFGVRILPDPRLTGWYLAHGMPMNDTLRSMTGDLSYEGTPPFQFYTDPRLADFRQWLVASGKGLYQRYLITHPLETLRLVWADRAALLAPFGFPPIFFSYFDGAFDRNLIARPDLIWIYAVAVATTVLTLIRALAWRDRTLLAGGLLCALLIAMVPPLLVVIDRADTMELTRHAIGLPLLLCLCALLGGFFLVAGRDAAPAASLRAMPR